MFEIHHLIRLAEAYAQAKTVEEKTVSNRVFGDSKKLSALREGGEITVGRFNAAVRWFSANWPDGVTWPERIPRPVTEAAE